MAGILARYFTVEEFGLWSMLISLNGILLSGFDLGFGNALRNRMAQLYAYGRDDESKVCFFSIFYWFICIALLLLGLFFGLKLIIPWHIVFKTTDPVMVRNGANLMVVGSSLLAFNIAFNLYTAGFFSYQQSHWNAGVSGAGKVLLLALTVVLLLALQSFFVINLMAFVVTLLSSVTGFALFLSVRKWKFTVIPAKIALKIVKELWVKSAQFALLQVFSTIILMADLFVVSKILGLEMVGEYFLVKRIYLVLASFHFAVLLPVWSAYTEAIESGDVGWAERILKKTALYSIAVFGLGTAVMYMAGNFLVHAWTGREVTDHSLFLLLGGWGLTYGWCNCFSVFLNAGGYVRNQVLLAGLGAFVFLTLSLAFGKTYGISGICVALVLACLPAAVCMPLESYGVLRDLRIKSRG